jgi:hypothetical protein
MSDGGKGCKPRPFSVSQQVFDNNFDRIFGKKKQSSEQEAIDEISKLTAEGTLDDTEVKK